MLTTKQTLSTDKFSQSTTDSITAVNYATLNSAIKTVEVNINVNGPGTVTVTNGSASITGTGTNFTDTTTGLGVGYWGQITFFDSSNNLFELVISASSATAATITTQYNITNLRDAHGTSTSANYTGVSGTYSYIIIRNYAEDLYSIAWGNRSLARNFSTAFGGGVAATGQTSLATGRFTLASGNRSTTMGQLTNASGVESFAGGLGTLAARTLASGAQSFNFSLNNGSQTAGHGANAAQSAILGGVNHNIITASTNAFIVGGNINKIAIASANSGIIGGSANTFTTAGSARSVIVGGNTITVSAAANDTVFMPKVRVGLGTGGSLSTTTTNDNLLARNSSTGELEIRDASAMFGTSGFGVNVQPSLADPASPVTITATRIATVARLSGITADKTINISGGSYGSMLTLHLQNDGGTGHTITWGAAITAATGTATLTTSKETVFFFNHNGTSWLLTQISAAL